MLCYLASEHERGKPASAYRFGDRQTTECHQYSQYLTPHGNLLLCTTGDFFACSTVEGRTIARAL